MKRYNVMDNGYRYDRVIFWIAFLFILGVIFQIALRNGFSFNETKIYLNCEDPNGCLNPLVENKLHFIERCRQQLRILFFIPLYTTEDCHDTCTESWCTQAVLPPGEYGTPPDPMIARMPALIIAILAVSLLFNHLWHNRGLRPKIQLNLKPSTREKIRRILKRTGGD